MKKIVLSLAFIFLVIFQNNIALSFNQKKVDKVVSKICVLISAGKLEESKILSSFNKYKSKYNNKDLNEIIDYIVIGMENNCVNNEVASINTHKNVINNNSVIIYPTGVYVSAGPTNERNYSVKENLLSYDYVDGILLRVSWRDLEKVKGNYDFSLIDYQIDLAKEYGKKITLSVIVETPDWFKNNENTFYYNYTGGEKDMAYPWNEDFLTNYKKLISALGNKYNNEETIGLVQAGNSSFNGIEMQYYRDIKESDLGYTNEKAIYSWKQVLSSFKESFPNKIIANDYHPILGNEEPTREIYDYAKENLGKNYGASMWWWTKPNTITYSKQDEVMTESINDSFGGVQFAQAGSKKPEKLSENGFDGLVDYSLERGVCYFEIWEIDIKNNDFVNSFEKIRNKCIK